MGYEVVLYVTKDETTMNYFHRFQKLWISGKYWEVQFVNDLTSDTMLIVYLKETFINEFADAGENKEPESENSEPITSAIQGLDSMYPFDTAIYKIQGYENGTWELNNTKAKINKQSFHNSNLQ